MYLASQRIIVQEGKEREETYQPTYLKTHKERKRRKGSTNLPTVFVLFCCFFFSSILLPLLSNEAFSRLIQTLIDYPYPSLLFPSCSVVSTTSTSVTTFTTFLLLCPSPTSITSLTTTYHSKKDSSFIFCIRTYSSDLNLLLLHH